MALRSDAASEYLSLTSVLSTAERVTFTSFAWVYVVTNPNQSGGSGPYYGTQIELGSSAGACAQLYTASTAVSPTANFRFSLYDGTNFDESSDATRTINTWYHVCMRRSETVLTLFVDGQRSFSLAANAITPGTAWRLFTDVSNTFYHNGRLSGFKFYPGVSLTAQQIRDERKQSMPVNRGCGGYYPLLGDNVPTGPHVTGVWTQTGTLTVEEEPAIPVRLARERRNKRYGDTWAAPGGTTIPVFRHHYVMQGAA